MITSFFGGAGVEGLTKDVSLDRNSSRLYSSMFCTRLFEADLYCERKESMNFVFSLDFSFFAVDFCSFLWESLMSWVSFWISDLMFVLTKIKY